MGCCSWDKEEFMWVHDARAFGATNSERVGLGISHVSEKPSTFWLVKSNSKLSSAENFEISLIKSLM